MVRRDFAVTQLRPELTEKLDVDASKLRVKLLYYYS